MPRQGRRTTLELSGPPVMTAGEMFGAEAGKGDVEADAGDSSDEEPILAMFKAAHASDSSEEEPIPAFDDDDADDETVSSGDGLVEGTVGKKKKKKKKTKGSSRSSPRKTPKKAKKSPPVALRVFSVTGVMPHDVSPGDLKKLAQKLAERKASFSVSLERGPLMGNLHVQGVIRILTTSGVALNSELRKMMGWEKGMGGHKWMCVALSGQGLHTWLGMVGYTLKVIFFCGFFFPLFILFLCRTA